MKLTVKLKIPDTTAITAFHTLERMGFDSLRKLDRFDYYEFDAPSHLKEKIMDVDILVNANKHQAAFDETFTGMQILVTNKEKDAGLLAMLRDRLGLSEIKDVIKGTLWHCDIDDPNPRKVATEIAEQLLANEHFEEFSIL